MTRGLHHCSQTAILLVSNNRFQSIP